MTATAGSNESAHREVGDEEEEDDILESSSYRVAITGAPGVGKSTLVMSVLDRLNCNAGGVLTQERRIGGKRVGFELLDLKNGVRGELATLEGEGPSMGRYRINLPDLEEVGAKAIETAIKDSNIIVIDEVGPMELFSERFINAAERALASDKPILLVVQARSQHPLAQKIREKFKLITVTEKNRDSIVDEVASAFKSVV